MNTMRLVNTSGTHVTIDKMQDISSMQCGDMQCDDNILLELYDTIVMQQHYECMKLAQWQELLSWYAEGA